MEWMKEHKTTIIVLIILLIGGSSGIYSLTVLAKEEEEPLLADAGSLEEEIIPIEEEKETEEETTQETVTLDIKGLVTSPGVYKVAINTRIGEVIDLAGGLLKNATTKNINLSKKVTDEMVIYIYSEEELKAKLTCKVENNGDGEITSETAKKESIIAKDSEKDTKLVSLNNATLEMLMTLDNVGEAKAKSIIAYREKTPFKTIEELKNVSGIGETIYDKIKDRLTI